MIKFNSGMLDKVQLWDVDKAQLRGIDMVQLSGGDKVRWLKSVDLIGVSRVWLSSVAKECGSARCLKSVAQLGG